MANLTEKQLEERPFTVQAAAEYLQVGRTTMFRLLREGKIPAVKVGGQWRITRANLEAYLAGDTAEKKA